MVSIHEFKNDIWQEKFSYLFLSYHLYNIFLSLVNDFDLFGIKCAFLLVTIRGVLLARPYHGGYVLHNLLKGFLASGSDITEL